MKPIKFPESNIIVAEDQPEYIPLPVFKDPDDPDAHQISCWDLDWKERIKILLTGKLWVRIMTFKQELQPLYFTVHKKEVLKQPVPENPRRWPSLSFGNWKRQLSPRYIQTRIYVKGAWTPLVMVQRKYK